jgi:putative redox protein
MPEVVTRCEANYKTVITTRELSWLADEPEEAGGTDTGPTPVEMLLGAISSCMAITMRLYANRKKWPLEAVDISMNLQRVKPEECPSYENKDDRSQITVIASKITLTGDLTEEQQKRIVEIGGRCPVHKIVAEGAHFIDEMSIS